MNFLTQPLYCFVLFCFVFWGGNSLLFQIIGNTLIRISSDAREISTVGRNQGEFRICLLAKLLSFFVTIIDLARSVRYHLLSFRLFFFTYISFNAQKMKFSIKDFFSKCDQICSFLRILSYLLKKSLMGNFIFCTLIRCMMDNVQLDMTGN